MAEAHLVEMTALQARDEMARGSVTAAEFAEACLRRIEEREPAVHALEHVDADLIMRRAKALDLSRAEGRPIGALHGVPVAIKDIIDTRDLPTENGTIFDRGRRPREDAFVVERLRAAGAVILGKAVTTELAVFTPGKTRNPHDPGRTPGGSSSGSAAAVGAGMAPLALGSQTNGSVIRPASFCGVVGYKPSRGLISRNGVLAQAETLDTIGTFSRTIEDAALFADTIAGYDSRDPASRLAAPPNLLAIATSVPPVRPRFAFVRSPVWEKAGEEVREGFAELIDVLGAAIEEVELPEAFLQAHGWHRVINMAEMARNYARYYERDPGLLSERLRGMIEEGRRVSAPDYLRARDSIPVLNAALDGIFEYYDAIVTPAAAGEAPLGLESTGDPAFCTIWTLCGVPAVSLPLMTGPNGMPVGVQLVGQRFFDGRLLRTARWLTETLRAEGQDVTFVLASGS